MDPHRTCKTCKVAKPLDAYEVTTKNGNSRRGVCKPCYAKVKAAKADAKAADHDPSSVPKPAACVKCGKGPDEVEYKWRADVQKGGWRTECNACYNAKGYDKEYRERECAKDKGAFLARNAATHLAWAHRNPNKVKEQQLKTATMPERRIKVIKTSATLRGVHFEDAEMDVMEAKMVYACHYCGYEPAPGETVNSLDRVDSDAGYTDANTVACCGVCNAMKGPLHVDVFVANVRAIHDHALGGEAVPPPTHDPTASTSTAVARRKLPPFSRFCDKTATEETKADKTNELGDDVNVQLWSGGCYLCGRTPALGIDRVDPTRGYEVGNVRSCCTDCNYMKKDLTLGDFLQHVGFVNAYTSRWVVGDVTDLPLVIWSGKQRTPVAVLVDDAPLIVFPSIASAHRTLGFALSSVSDAVNGIIGVLRGRAWRLATPREYRTQPRDRDYASIIVSLRSRAAV